MRRAVSAGFVLVLCVSARVGAGEGEKLLFGFERDEVEKVAASKKSFAVVEDGAFQVSPPSSNNTALEVMNGIVTWSVVQGDVTQGTHALKVPGPRGGPNYLHEFPEADSMGLACDPRANTRLPEVFNTCPWYARVFPADWSGWDLLRVDVKVLEDRPATLILEVEDALVEPPVSLTYADVKPGAWTTLELDLGKAVEERHLDLTSMSNIFLRFDGRKDVPPADGKSKRSAAGAAGAVLMDNVRLARRGAACALTVLQGERSSYTMNLPQAYAANLIWKMRQGGLYLGVTAAEAPVPRPVKVEPAAVAESGKEAGVPAPAVVEILPLLQKGFEPKAAGGSKNVTADNLHQCVELQTVTAPNENAILICFAMPLALYSMKLDKPFAMKFGPVAAVVTTDGGKAWGGLAGPGEPPTWLHKGRKVWEGTAFDAGADVMGLFDDGCLTFRYAYEFYPCDRIFLWRTVWTGTGWKQSPLFLVSGDPRWCTHQTQNLLQLPSGRLWCMFSSRGRDGKMAAWAKYSDDDGLTWHSWRGDGMVGTLPPLSKDEVRAELFPYGDQVGMMAPKGKWILFDGKAWAEGPASPVKTPVEVVACGRDIYVIDAEGPLSWYDGAAWKTLELPGRENYPRFYLSRVQSPGAREWRSQQSFTVCGDTVLFVEPDKTGKKILCWRKAKDGAWTGPQELVSEETPIADLVAPRYSQAGFAPVAYNCWTDDTRSAKGAGSRNSPEKGGYALRDLKPWIKVLRVPVRAP